MDSDRTVKRSEAAASRRTRAARRVRVAGDATDHRFLGDENGEYDTLTARGRSYYDDLRWHNGYEHNDAFAEARRCYGVKST